MRQVGAPSSREYARCLPLTGLDCAAGYRCAADLALRRGARFDDRATYGHGNLARRHDKQIGPCLVDFRIGAAFKAFQVCQVISPIGQRRYPFFRSLSIDGVWARLTNSAELHS